MARAIGLRDSFRDECALANRRNDMIKRRDFVQLVTAGAAAAGLERAESVGAAPQGSKRALMKLGCQNSPTDDKKLQFFARHGVRNICGYPEESGGRNYATVEELQRLK